MELQFTNSVPAWFNNVPLLVLDGTADEKVLRATLTHRDYRAGSTRPFFGLRWTEVKAEDRGVVRLKVIGAPTSMGDMMPAGLKAIAERFEKATEFGKPLEPERLSRDEVVEQFGRTIRALGDRVKPNVPDATG